MSDRATKIKIGDEDEIVVTPATEETLQIVRDNIKDIGEISTGNSTTTPLGIGGVFTGTAVDTIDFVTINIVAYSNVASATDGLSIQFSTDGTNWDLIETHTVSAATIHTQLFRAKGRYFRIVYTNGGIAQTTFRLATLLKRVAVSMTFERLDHHLEDSNDGALVRAVLAAKKPDNDYTNIESTAAGNLKVSIEETNGTSNIALATTSTSAITSVASSASNVTLLVSNTSRRMATFYNDSTAIAYLKLGATATTSSYTVQIPPQTYYELPMPCYTAIIDCIWASANGSMRITELT